MLSNSTVCGLVKCVRAYQLVLFAATVVTVHIFAMGVHPVKNRFGSVGAFEQL